MKNKSSTKIKNELTALEEKTNSQQQSPVKLYREISVETLRIIYEHANWPDSVRRLIAMLKTQTGCDAVGLRLRQGDDYPYFTQDGFSDEFITQENSILECSAQGVICRDKDGQARLECTCGLVISGRTDPANPLFTPGGSAWTNNSFELLDIPSDQDPRNNPRNQCIHQNYASVALTPVRNGDKIVGLLQFNSRRKGFFTLEAIEALEGIAAHVGSALMRKQAEAALAEAHQNLEKKVQERTEALEKTNQLLAQEIEERKKYVSLLKESEQRYRIVTDNAYDWVFWLSPQQDILYISPSCIRITGFSAQEFQQDPQLLLKIVHPEDLSKFEEHYHHAFKKDSLCLKGIIFRIIHKNGAIRWLSHLCGPAFGDDGAYIGIRGSNRDITEQKMSEQALLESENKHQMLEKQLRQAQKMEAIGTLAAGIAHDFNNILGAVSGFTELTLGQVPTDSKANKYLNRIFGATRRAVDLISQILEFSRQTEKQLNPLRISPIIKEIIKLIRSTTPASVEIRQNIVADPDLAIADTTYIHQIFLNLCTNANHAMQKNGGILSVALTNETIVSPDGNHPGINPGSYLKLTVCDTGEGIEPGIIDKIFDPFFTTKKQGEGTGLGLSVAYGIVKNLGGEITVESRPGQGTSFEVWLPAFTDSLLTPTSAEEHIARDKCSGKILFVDDEDVLVEMAQEMLQELGYEVTATQSSKKALQLFAADPDRFDLVITDQTMPEMTGMDLAREIMKIKPGAPVILCTGFSSVVNEAKATKAGIRAFLIKPIIKSRLDDCIREILRMEG